MAKRLIESKPEIMSSISGREFLESLFISGGRAISAEWLPFKPPLIDGICTASLLAANGADIIHLNHYDVNKPSIAGFASTPAGIAAWQKCGVSIQPTEDVEAPIHSFFSQLGLGVTMKDLAQSIGRVVGVSLEVLTENPTAPVGRLATPETAQKAYEQGAAYITLIGTPAHSTQILTDNVRLLRSSLGSNQVIVIGRMPWGGSKKGVPDFIHAEEIEQFVEAGVDMVVLPAPGTMPGATMEEIIKSVEMAHKCGVLAEITIGTSQESSDEETIRRLALDSKLTGADLYQIGDGGYNGAAMLENVLAFTLAIKGKRHFYKRIIQ